jgi:hypothetical protein
MVGRKRTPERRKSKRYKAAEGAYAAISPSSHKIGQIIDISMGGLAFKYIDTKNQTQSEESIFLSSMGFYVGNLPFKTILQIPVHSVHSIRGIPSTDSD